MQIIVKLRGCFCALKAINARRRETLNCDNLWGTIYHEEVSASAVFLYLDVNIQIVPISLKRLRNIWFYVYGFKESVAVLKRYYFNTKNSCKMYVNYKVYTSIKSIASLIVNQLLFIQKSKMNPAKRVSLISYTPLGTLAGFNQ